MPPFSLWLSMHSPHSRGESALTISALKFVDVTTNDIESGPLKWLKYLLHEKLLIDGGRLDTYVSIAYFLLGMVASRSERY